MPGFSSLPHNLKHRVSKSRRRRRNLRATQDVAVADVWAGALDEELDFWRDWMRTKGSSWPEDFRFRLDPESLIQDSITTHLDGIGSRVRMLDVGAGPLTFVGKRWPDHDFELSAVDALADRYDMLLEEYDLDPPVRTRRCESERLLDLFAPGGFDVAYALNTLDHSYEPLTAIRQMVEIVRPGGKVLLQHHPNEAENEAYSGLHQWNFDWVDGDGVLWRPGERWQMRDEFATRATVTGGKADDLVTIVLTRSDAPSADTSFDA
jgi:SAM-dependent methyltransferase